MHKHLLRTAVALPLIVMAMIIVTHLLSLLATGFWVSMRGASASHLIADGSSPVSSMARAGAQLAAVW